MASAAPDNEDTGQAMDQLESSIVQGFQNLQVLNAYNVLGDQMGDLVRDLTTALEDSVKQKTCHKKEKEDTPIAKHRQMRKGKRKSKKRKSTQPYTALSDSKESSLDEAIKDYIENITQQSDSDDWIVNSKGVPCLTAIQKQIPQVESDSFTENFSPMQPLRHRRRKFKRMAVDLSPDTNVEPLLTKNPTIKLRSKVHLTSSDNIMDEDHRSRSPVTPGTSLGDTLPGKRKRGMRCPGNSFEVDPGNDDCFTKCVDREDKMDQDHK